MADNMYRSSLKRRVGSLAQTQTFRKWRPADIGAAISNIGLWPEADVVWVRRDVRFQAESGHEAD